MVEDKKIDETDPMRDMTKHGWLKALTWLDVKETNDGKWILSEIDYDIRTFYCHGCKSNDYLWLVPQRAGVFIACTMCETVDGPISTDDGVVADKREIQPAEALMIKESRGDLIPPSLRKAVGRKLSRVKRGERPKNKF